MSSNIPITDNKLDKYEKSVESALRLGQYKPVDKVDSMTKFFTEAAKNYRILQKSRPITIRVNQTDLLKVKAKAKKSNIPYQTLLSSLIHYFAEGWAKIDL